MKKTLLSTVIASVLLVGCGSEENNLEQPKDQAPLLVTTTFTARHVQTLPAKNEKLAAYAVQQTASTERAEKVTQVRYVGKLEVTNVESNEEQVFDWPVTQTVDADGKVTTTSHRALTLKPGAYDFALLLATEGPDPKQYLAKDLEVEVVEGEQPAIEFIVEPNLGNTITDFDEMAYVSKLAFQWQAEELASLEKPQFGLSVNGEEEEIFETNKETSLAEITMNAEPGEYTLALRLYDGDLLVGKNEDDATVNFVEGEDAQTDIIPLQADVVFEVAEIKDRGTIAFTIPDVVIEEVGGVENLTVKASITAQGMAPQEHVLEILDVNGTHIAKEMFETGGAKNLGVHLEFYDTSASQALADLTPFTRCNTTVTVEANQTLGCKLELKRESIITNRILGTLRINAVNENWTPAEVADVFLNGEKVGVTGSAIGAGTFKTHLVAGEYQVEIKQGSNAASDKLTLQPLDVLNTKMFLKTDISVGTGNFVSVASIDNGDVVYSGKFFDVNNDGKADFVYTSTSGQYVVMLGDGKFGFRETERVFLSHSEGDVIHGDINGDGYQDIAILGTSIDKQSAYHSIDLGNGDGTFRSFGSGVLSDYVHSTSGAFIDMDKDGKLELVAAIGFYHMGVYTLNSENRFERTAKYQVENTPLTQFADFDNDGYTDIVAGTLWLNDGNGELYQHDGISLLRPDIHYTAVGDFNGNGNVDIFVAEGSSNYQNSNFVYNNQGFALFGQGQEVTPLPIREKPAVGDINGDGKADIISPVVVPTSATTSKTNVYGFIQGQHGEFQQKALNVSTTRKLWLADLDGDGDLDLIRGDINSLLEILENTPAQ